LARTSATADGDPLPFDELVAVADELQRRGSGVATRQQPAQVAGGLLQAAPRVGRE
jgi:hypothetical protein